MEGVHKVLDLPNPTDGGIGVRFLIFSLNSSFIVIGNGREEEEFFSRLSHSKA